MHLKVFRYYAITLKKLKSLHYQGLAALMPVNTKSKGRVLHVDILIFSHIFIHFLRNINRTFIRFLCSFSGCFGDFNVQILIAASE